MKSRKEVVCPACKGMVALRINRNGFLQRRVLSFLGYYPWKCGACGTTFLFRQRGVRGKAIKPLPGTHGAAHGETRA